MSTLEVSNLNDGTTTVATTFVTNGSAKVWVNFNGGGTIATRDSLNVASLTDDAAGRYTVNISNNMANDDFAALNYTSGSTSSSQTAFNNNFLGGNGNAVGSFKISAYSASFEDSDVVMATVHGDLA
tara:strand:+ start:179 stop:559 length:381 start_codon:yes stop_codon:yes gene_type:complete